MLCLESAFALILVERLDASCGDIGKAAVERREGLFVHVVLRKPCSKGDKPDASTSNRKNGNLESRRGGYSP